MDVKVHLKLPKILLNYPIMKSLDYTVLIVPELKMCYQPWVLIKIVLGVWNIDSPQGITRYC